MTKLVFVVSLAAILIIALGAIISIKVITRR